MSTILEEYVDNLYISLGIKFPHELRVINVAKLFGLHIRWWSNRAVRYGRTILLNSNNSPEWQKISFYHELGHYTRHVGIQTSDVPELLIKWQEWDARRFMLYAAIPSYMLKKVDLTREGVIYELAEEYQLPVSIVEKRVDIVLRRNRFALQRS